MWDESVLEYREMARWITVPVKLLVEKKNPQDRGNGILMLAGSWLVAVQYGTVERRPLIGSSILLSRRSGVLTRQWLAADCSM